MLDLLGGLIGAGARIWGGIEDRKAAERAQEMQNQQALRNEALQREFAQTGIRWKVDDARAAGIHPLYALGAPTTSFNPVALGDVARPSMSDTFGEAGQDISRAISATRTAGEKARATQKTVAKLSIDKMGLENELLKTQIAKERSQIGPAMPSMTDMNVIDGQGDTALVPLKKKYDDADRLILGGKPVVHSRKTSPAEKFEDWYGELGENIYGPLNWYRDMVKTGRIDGNRFGPSIEDVFESFPKSWMPGSGHLIPGSWLDSLRNDVRARNQRRLERR